MKKKRLLFCALLCLVINVTSCTPVALTPLGDNTYATGDEADDPAEPDDDD